MMLHEAPNHHHPQLGRRSELQRWEEGALHRRLAKSLLGAEASAAFAGNRSPVTHPCLGHKGNVLAKAGINLKAEPEKLLRNHPSSHTPVIWGS